MSDDPVINMRRATGRSAAMSEPRVAVGEMSTHVCVWFEDSWPEHRRDCGARAVTISA